MARYQVKFDDGDWFSVDNLTWNTSYQYDSSLRPDNATSSLSITSNSFRRPTIQTHPDRCEPFDPQFVAAVSIGDYVTLSLQKICDNPNVPGGITSIPIFTNKKAKLVNNTNNNSLDPSSIQLRTYIEEYEIYEENDILPGTDIIKNVSSLSYNYSFSTGDDYGDYVKPFTEDSVDGVPEWATPRLEETTESSSRGHSTQIVVTINAVGINTNGGDKLTNANNAINTINSFADINGRLLLEEGDAYDKTEVINTDASAGSINQTITYTKYPGTGIFRDSYKVDITYDNRSAETYTIVSINGQIQGLNTAANTSLGDNRSLNASIGWTQTSTQLNLRAQTALSSVNPLPISKEYSYEDQGIIRYNYTYDNRPLALVSGAISESISMSDSYQTKIMNHIPFIGGVLLQNLGTYNLPSRSVSYTARFLRGYPIPSNVSDMMRNAVNQFDPQKMDTAFIASVVDTDESSTDLINNSVTLTKKWTYFIKDFYTWP